MLQPVGIHSGEKGTGDVQNKIGPLERHKVFLKCPYLDLRCLEDQLEGISCLCDNLF